MKVKSIGFCVTLSLLVSCSGMKSSGPIDEDRIPTKQVRKLPITKTSQSMNVPYKDLFPLALGVFKNRSIPLAEVDSSKGEIKSSLLPIKEKFCGVTGSSTAPVDCNVVYTVKLAPLTPIASKFTISYLEECERYELGPLECAGSNAEQLMLDVVKDLKLAAGVVDEE